MPDENEDRSLLDQLTACGCPLPDGIESVGQIPPDAVLSVVRKCVSLLADAEPGSDDERPDAETKADRVLAANAVAAKCQELGFSCSYDLFLYPNEADLRSALAFVLGKIEERKSKEKSEGKIAAKLREQLAKPWYPPYCIPRTFQIRPDGRWTRTGCGLVEPFLSEPLAIPKHDRDVTKAFVEYWKKAVPDCDLSGRYTNVADPQARADEILKQLKEKRQFCRKENVFFKNSDQIEQKEDIVDANDGVQSINPQLLEVDSLRNEDNRIDIIKSLLSDEENISHVESLHDKLMENIKMLEESIADKREALKQTEVQNIVPDDFEESDELRSLEERIKLKTEKLKKIQKSKVYLAASPDKERLIYANDAIETIDHLIKLKADMGKIISNINTTQKDINRINGALDRSFVVADELIFKDAKKDEFARKTYKLIANVHTECNELCNMVEEIGTFTRDTVAIEKNVETAQLKNTKENLHRAMEDLRNLSLQKM